MAPRSPRCVRRPRPKRLAGIAQDQGVAAFLRQAGLRTRSAAGPAQWMPTDAAYHCTYTATWGATKLRWDLAVDDAERQAPLGAAENCSSTTVTYETAP
ncbi:hypothetical protein OHB07_00880 [Streptomyces sp. NBC_00111]|uniref:hypothetical protein n=2 Tax=Streptomyces TaxID=1883 RepID=UPI002E3698F3|nr:hypothetical protein [Streptomyces sp. NBC_01460]